MSPQKEGLEIIQVLNQYFPKRFEAKDSIRWLHQFSNQKRQDEWAGFFFQEYSVPLLTKFLGGWKGPRITKGSRFDYQREYVWDLKLESNYNSKGKPIEWVILNDKETTDRVIKLESGTGIIIARANFSFDKDGSLKKWRDKFENKKTRKKVRGARILKKTGQITDLKTIFIKDMSQVESAIKDGWLEIFKQGKNTNGKPRPPKYKIKIRDVPNQFITSMN